MGDAKAMNNYAAMLEEGQGVNADMNEAAKYYKMAAEKGEKTAIINYAYMLKKGKIDNSDTQEVMKYYKMAAECGENEFCPYEIVKYYRMSADYGDVSSMEMYAKLMDDNEEGDSKEAAKYFKMAANHGSVESMIIYATKAYNGEGIDVDKSEASTYYKMAADSNDSTEILNYARMLSNDDGIPADKEEAEKYYKLSEDDSESESSNEEIIKDFENTDKSDDENQNDLDHFAFSLYNKQSSFKKGSNDRQPLSLLFVGNNDSDNTKLFSAIYNSQLQKVNKQKDDCMFTINSLENGIQGMVSYTDLKTKEKTLQMIDSWDPFNIIVIVFSLIDKSSLEDAYYKWYLQFPCYRLEKKFSIW